jgi:hypothetical protein
MIMAILARAPELENDAPTCKASHLIGPEAFNLTTEIREGVSSMTNKTWI